VNPDGHPDQHGLPPDTHDKLPVGPADWPLIAVRILLMLAALRFWVPVHYLCKPFTQRNPAPRMFLLWIGWICGLRVSVQGTRPQPGTFLIANHISWLDIPALAGTTGTAFIAQDGLATIRPLRWLCELNDTVWISRTQRTRVASQVASVRAALRETGALTVFPEGTTSDGTGLLPFKSPLLSALEADSAHVPVRPVWLDFGAAGPEIAWVGTEPGLHNALRILARWRPIRVDLHFLSPLEGEERLDRKAMARGAQSRIAAAMQAKRRQSATPPDQRVAL
jgi:lyso-ornithine lipid O-acyltransferase